MRRLIIWPGISRRIGACRLTHEDLPVFLNGLRSDLENHYSIYCVLRDEEKPRYFRYLVAFADGGVTHDAMSKRENSSARSCAVSGISLPLLVLQ